MGISKLPVTCVIAVKPSVPKCWLDGGELVGGAVSLHCTSAEGSTPLEYKWRRESKEPLPAAAATQSKSDLSWCHNATTHQTLCAHAACVCYFFFIYILSNQKRNTKLKICHWFSDSTSANYFSITLQSLISSGSFAFPPSFVFHSWHETIPEILPTVCCRLNWSNTTNKRKSAHSLWHFWGKYEKNLSI